MSRREGVLVFLIGIVAVFLSGCIEPNRPAIYSSKWGEGTPVPIEEVMIGVKPKESGGDNAAGGALLGGIIGGSVASVAGVSTAVGAIGGAMVGAESGSRTSTVVLTPDFCGFRFRYEGKVYTTYFPAVDPYVHRRYFEKCLLLRRSDLLTVAPLIRLKDGVETSREFRWRINEEVSGVLK